MTRNYWTTVEDKILASMVRSHSHSEIAEKLGRSYWAVVNRTRHLGLNRYFRKSAPPRIEPSQAQIEIGQGVIVHRIY